MPLSLCKSLKIAILRLPNPNRFDYYMKPELKARYEVPSLFSQVNVCSRSGTIKGIYSSNIGELSATSSNSNQTTNYKITAKTPIKIKLNKKARRYSVEQHFNANNEKNAFAQSSIRIQAKSLNASFR